MSYAGQFDDGPAAGFARRHDAKAAARQVLVSFVLVLVLALATIFVGFLARPDTHFSLPNAPPFPAWTTVRAM